MTEDRKPKRIWDNHKHLTTIKKSNSTMFKVELVARDGIKYLNVREWYKNKKSNQWKPSSKGLVIPIKIPIDEKPTRVLEEFAKVVGNAIEEAENFQIEDKENEIWY